MSVGGSDPRHDAWRRQLLWLSSTLTVLGLVWCLLPAGAVVVTLAGIWHPRNLLGLAAMGVAATPLAVTGLTGGLYAAPENRQRLARARALGADA